MAREYDIIQLTGSINPDDNYSPLNRRPSISDDGSRVVFAARREPGGVGYFIRVHDSAVDEVGSRELSVTVDGEERALASYNPRISGDGEKIVFDAMGDYIGDGLTGIYIYNLNTGAIRRVVADVIPRWPSGAPRMGEPDLFKRVNKRPAISADGSWISYISTIYGHHGSTRDHWRKTREELMIAHIEEDRISGGEILRVILENVFGHGIRSQSISGNGRVIAFYAGGEIEGLEVENLTMPPYDPVRHSETAAPTCDVYCYVVLINGPGRYTLRAVPEPDHPGVPLVAAHPHTSNVQSFDMINMIVCPPSISSNGSRIALSGGFAMGETKTGVYVYEHLDQATRRIISFGAVPGADGEETLTTGALPAISGDGRCLAYYKRDVVFPDGYGEPVYYEEGETYCPCVQKDEVLVREIPVGERANLLEDDRDPVIPNCTRFMGLDIDRDGAHVAFISTADKVGMNDDCSHEIYLASLTSSD